MDRRPRPPPGHVFVVHLRKGTMDLHRPAEWHGKVHNLTTGEIRTFRGWDDLVQRLKDLLG